MDKTTLNAQLVTTELKRVFYHLKSVDCERLCLWKVLVWLPMKWSAWFYCLSDLSSDVVSRASFPTFFTASNSFWNIQNLCSTMSWLQEFYIAAFSFFTCNFYQAGLLRKMWKFDLKKHGWELFQYSSVFFDNRFELNSYLKAIVEMTRPNKHQSRTVGQIVKSPIKQLHALWSEVLACNANCWQMIAICHLRIFGNI